jgi:hypothetical protein
MHLIDPSVRCSRETGLGYGKDELCLACFEKRVGRKLRPSDIDDYGWLLAEVNKSESVRNRLRELIRAGGVQ